MSKTRKSIIEVHGIGKSVQNLNFNYGECAAIKSFKPLEFDGFKKQASINASTKSPSARCRDICVFSIDTPFIYTYTARVEEVCHAEKINHNS